MRKFKLGLYRRIVTVLMRGALFFAKRAQPKDPAEVLKGAETAAGYPVVRSSAPLRTTWYGALIRENNRLSERNANLTDKLFAMTFARDDLQRTCTRLEREYAHRQRNHANTVEAAIAAQHECAAASQAVALMSEEARALCGEQGVMLVLAVHYFNWEYERETSPDYVAMRRQFRALGTLRDHLGAAGRTLWNKHCPEKHRVNEATILLS